jgi:hypothetical protein
MSEKIFAKIPSTFAGEERDNRRGSAIERSTLFKAIKRFREK